MSTNITVDGVEFVKKIADSILKTKKWAYEPYNKLDQNKAHGALMDIGAQAEALIAFCESVVRHPSPPPSREVDGQY